MTTYYDVSDQPKWLTQSTPPPSAEDAVRTVQEAHDQLWEQIWGDDGPGEPAVCPCCDRRTYVRRQALNKSVAVALVRLTAAQLRTGLPHTRKEVGADGPGTNDVSYLSRWGLLETRAPGIYWVFPKGILWVYGRLVLPRAMRIFDARIIKRWSLTRITIREALGDRVSELDALPPLGPPTLPRKRRRADD